ncbi:MAG: hypothetical protein IT324_21745 [Anaerolineae bacterium]|nr:hypothetical protein [Anaerolineae bacterium]
MNTPVVAASWPSIWTIVGTVLALGITVATAAGINLPVISSERIAVFALIIVGFVMCSIGGSGRAIGSYGITHPISIVGAILGLLVFLVGASVLFSFKLPLIADDRTAVFVVAGLIVIKLVINGGFYFLTR